MIPQDMILREMQVEVQKLLLANQPGAAVALAHRYLRHYEQDAFALSVIADCLFGVSAATGEATLQAEAINLLERAAALEPHSPRWLVALGDMYSLDNALPANYQRAAEYYLSARLLEPHSADAASRLAGLYGLVDTISQDQAISYARQAIAYAEPPGPLEYARLGRLLVTQGQRAEAREQFSKALITFNQQAELFPMADADDVRMQLQQKIAELELDS